MVERHRQQSLMRQLPEGSAQSAVNTVTQKFLSGDAQVGASFYPLHHVISNPFYVFPTNPTRCLPGSLIFCSWYWGITLLIRRNSYLNNNCSMIAWNFLLLFCKYCFKHTSCETFSKYGWSTIVTRLFYNQNMWNMFHSYTLFWKPSFEMTW
jgi:hypothetical protein